MTVVDTPTDLTPLSVAMRDGSKAEHEAAESTEFMAELLGGGLVPQAYADYLRRYHAVYAALEDAVRRFAGDPIIDAVADVDLERLPAIEADLDHWVPGWRELPPVDSPATRAYVQRLEGATWAGDVLAHHYTRYLGDLSGGQAIGRVLDRTFDLDGAGIAFYEFAAIPKPKPYKDGYRARLDSLGLCADDIDRVVEEVKVVFGLNQAIFLELGRDIDSYRR